MQDYQNKKALYSYLREVHTCSHLFSIKMTQNAGRKVQITLEIDKLNKLDIYMKK